MIYKFKSEVAADLIMLGPHGDAMLRAMGREPAPRGIFEAAHLPALIQALEAAIADDEARRAEAQAQALAEGREPPPRPDITARTRLWPMIELLRQAQRADVPVVWGV
ncbi:MAG: hypothetical protein RLY78_2419 [Pseudomonadota bacterium]|jgi:hypothetical protein|uniref:DUF1840 domain-containing protein n=1 Tax=Pseudaquabacterium rugosum TaxID=2984194 RepID=A0ABU9B3P9_9BURK